MIEKTLIDILLDFSKITNKYLVSVDCTKFWSEYDYKQNNVEKRIDRLEKKYNLDSLDGFFLFDEEKEAKNFFNDVTKDPLNFSNVDVIIISPSEERRSNFPKMEFNKK